MPEYFWKGEHVTREERIRLLYLSIQTLEAAIIHARLDDATVRELVRARDYDRDALALTLLGA
jgi:hypothetical protein